MADLPVGLRPDLRPGEVVVRVGILRIGVLIGLPAARRLPGQLGGHHVTVEGSGRGDDKRQSRGGEADRHTGDEGRQAAPNLRQAQHRNDEDGDYRPDLDRAGESHGDSAEQELPSSAEHLPVEDQQRAEQAEKVKHGFEQRGMRCTDLRRKYCHQAGANERRKPATMSDQCANQQHVEGCDQWHAQPDRRHRVSGAARP